MKMSPLAKKMGLLIFVITFSLFPYKWGSSHSQAILDEINSKKSEISQAKELIANVEAKKNLGDLNEQVTNLRVKEPDDASLPVFIPMVAKVAQQSNMNLVSGTPTKATGGTSASQTKLNNPPAGTSIFAMDVVFTGPSANLQFLLNQIENMPRVVSIERFQTSAGGASGFSNIAMTIKFYSVKGA